MRTKWTQKDIDDLVKQGRVKVQGKEVSTGRTNELEGVVCDKEEKKKNKHGAIESYVDNMRFDSMAEARYYVKLKQLQKAGKIKFFLRQTRFDLTGNVRYRLDFMIFWADGRTTCVDVKGYETDMFKLKKKQTEALYPVTIEVVKC